jgi:curved DNA-binding protein CbpA
MKDYYAILNVKTTATSEEIKSAYRDLALKYHPDRNRDPVSSARFVEINEAYSVLSKPHSRALYDLRLTEPKRSRKPVNTGYRTDGKRYYRYYARPVFRESSASYLEYVARLNRYSRYIALSLLILPAIVFVDFAQEEKVAFFQVEKKEFGQIEFTVYSGDKSYRIDQSQYHTIQVGQYLKIHESAIFEIPFSAEIEQNGSITPVLLITPAEGIRILSYLIFAMAGLSLLIRDHHVSVTFVILEILFGFILFFAI